MKSPGEVEAAKVDNKGMRLMCMKYYDERKKQYLRTWPGSEDKAVQTSPLANADKLFWIVNISIGKMTSERLFQGHSLHQLVDAVYEFADMRSEEQKSWDFYLQGSLLSQWIGKFRPIFTVAQHWGMTWGEVRLSDLACPGEVIHVQLMPRSQDKDITEIKKGEYYAEQALLSGTRLCTT